MDHCKSEMHSSLINFKKLNIFHLYKCKHTNLADTVTEKLVKIMMN